MGMLPHNNLIREAFTPKPFVDYKPNRSASRGSLAPGQFTPRDDLPVRARMDNTVNLSVDEVYSLFSKKTSR